MVVSTEKTRCMALCSVWHILFLGKAGRAITTREALAASLLPLAVKGSGPLIERNGYIWVQRANAHSGQAHRSQYLRSDICSWLL